VAISEREFYRTFQGPEVGDEDTWALEFDRDASVLRVLHHWTGGRDSGVAEYGVDDFLARPGAARDALVSLLSGEGR
jgi:hypothetical protein